MEVVFINIIKLTFTSYNMLNTVYCCYSKNKIEKVIVLLSLKSSKQY